MVIILRLMWRKWVAQRLVRILLFKYLQRDLMSESLFNGATPDNTNNSDGAPGLTLGTRIRFTIDGTVSGVSWRFPDGQPSAQVQWLLWEYFPATDASGLLLGSGVFPFPADIGQWNTINF